VCGAACYQVVARALQEEDVRDEIPDAGGPTEADYDQGPCGVCCDVPLDVGCGIRAEVRG
jgi:hypothetical protein